MSTDAVNRCCSRLRANISQIQAITGNRRVVYSVNIGGYDVFVNGDDVSKSATNDEGTDYICVLSIPPETHSRSIVSEREEKIREECMRCCSPWRFVLAENPFDSDIDRDRSYGAFLWSRFLKILTHRFFDCYDQSLYLDYNVRLNNPVVHTFWRRALGEDDDDKVRLQTYAVAAFEHPNRVRLADEFGAVRKAHRAAPLDGKIRDVELFEAQISTYKSEGAFVGSEVAGLKLTWNNVMFRRHNSPLCVAIMEAWFVEVAKWRTRDQLSFVYAWWRCCCCRGDTSHDIENGNNDLRRQYGVNVLPLRDARFPFSRTTAIVNKDAEYKYFSLLNYYFCRPYGGQHVRVKRRVVFLTQFPQHGSNYLRGNQVCEALRRCFVRADVIEIQKGRGNHSNPNDPSLRDVRDAVIFFVGRVSAHHAPVLRSRNNVIVLDLVDKYCELHDRPEDIRRTIEAVDAIVCPNETVRRELTKKYGFRKPCVVIRHHWDPRLAVASRVGYQSSAIASPGRHDDFEKTKKKRLFGYMGSLSTASKNMLHLRHLVQKFDMGVIDTESGDDVTDLVRKGGDAAMRAVSRHRPDNMTRVDPDFDCHVSVRGCGSPEWRYKTDTKVSTAAFFGAPIVTTREDAVVNVLPRNYPYYIKSDELGDVEDALERVKKTYMTGTWYRAVETMRELRHKSSLDYLVKDYVKFLANFQ